MADPSATDRAYLLGEVSAEDAERLELDVMADQAVADRLITAENDLIDEYLEGSLTSIDRQKFEAAFMSIPARAERVKFARELAQRASTRTNVTWGNRTTWAPLLVAATLLIAVGLWYSARTTPPPQVASAPGTPARKSVSFVLALTATRGEQTPSVTIPAGTDDLVLQIDLAGETRFTTFDAVVTTQSGARDVWKTSGPISAASGGVLAVTVPVSSGINQPGVYELTLTGRPATNQPRLLAAIPFAVR